MSDDRETLADFLRTRRAKVSPAEVGLPPGTRRRTPGLRRDEVAVLAGISPTWYRYLEQGRTIQPSGQVLEALARVLLLTEDERRYLHLLASRTLDPEQPLPADVSGEAIIRQLVDLNEDSPYPVYAADVSCDLVAWNPAAIRYYGEFGATSSQVPNILRWMLFHPNARRRLPHWPVARYLDRALAHIADRSGIWLTTSDEIAAHFAATYPWPGGSCAT